jgi:hypothetical protein
MANARGLIAVDKMGTKVLFLDPATYATEVVLDGFDKTVHELLVMPDISRAYVPIFGDGIHGRNPHPQHWLCVLTWKGAPCSPPSTCGPISPRIRSSSRPMG